jgi:ketosteroid isomerase-like protein
MNVSQENVELVKRFFELFREGEWRHLEMLAADVVYRPIAEIMGTGEFYGPAGYRRYMEDFFDDSWWGEMDYEVTSYRDHDDKVIARIQMMGRGRTSGADVSARVFAVFTIRDGKIAREEDFTDRSEALRAASIDV